MKFTNGCTATTASPPPRRGRLSAADYRDLLARLYGFHAAFDVAMTQAPEALAQDMDLPSRARAGLLTQDLRGLGVASEAVARLPLARLAPLEGEGAHLGALYVVEGSTLGGTLIARALTGFGADRRFYLGHGGENGRMWRNFLERLETLDESGAEAAEHTASAVFSAFEAWMVNWRGAMAHDATEAA